MIVKSKCYVLIEHSCARLVVHYIQYVCTACMELVPRSVNRSRA